MTETATQEIAEATTRAGKYLTFIIADESYGLEILKVREIIGIMDITGVPKTPEFVKGVINLRGKVIPVIDLRLKFSMEEAERTEETCIIVVSVNDLEIGIVVDQVSEVQNISAQEIEDAPEFGAQVDTEFILGMGKVGDRVTILLDITNVLGGANVTTVRDATEIQDEPNRNTN